MAVAPSPVEASGFPDEAERPQQAPGRTAAGKPSAAPEDPDAVGASGDRAQGAGRTKQTDKEASPPRGIESRTVRRRDRRERLQHEQERIGQFETQKSIALTTLTVLAVLTAMYVARAILIPTAMAITLTLTCRPFVRVLKRRGVPLALSAGVIVAGLIGFVLIGATYLTVPAQKWIAEAPNDLREVGNRLDGLREKLTWLQAASAKIENLAEGKADEEGDLDAQPGSEAPSSPAELGSRLDEANGGELVEKDSKRPVEVEVKQPRLASGLQVLGSAGSVLASIALMLVLSFFLLSAGDSLINNVLQILPSMREKRNVVELVYKVEQGISSYLSTVACINAGLGLCIGLAMWALGMPNPALWGLMAAVFNFVPYLGAMAGTLIVSLVAVLSFDSLGYAVLIPIVYFAFTAIEGNFVTPTLLGRSMSLNPVMVFLSLTFWGWMWGIMGALLAVPILAMLKIGFDQFERTRPVGTLLGG